MLSSLCPFLLLFSTFLLLLPAQFLSHCLYRYMSPVFTPLSLPLSPPPSSLLIHTSNPLATAILSSSIHILHPLPPSHPHHFSSSLSSSSSSSSKRKCTFSKINLPSLYFWLGSKALSCCVCERSQSASFMPFPPSLLLFPLTPSYSHFHPFLPPFYISPAQHNATAGIAPVTHEQTSRPSTLPPSLPPSLSLPPAYVSPAQHGVAAHTGQVADGVEARHEHALFRGAGGDVDAAEGGREGGRDGGRGGGRKEVNESQQCSNYYRKQGPPPQRKEKHTSVF